MKSKKKHIIWEILLFSSIGAFSLFFLSRNSDLSVRLQEKILTVQNLLAVIVMYNGFGLSVMYVNHRIRSVQDSFMRNWKQVIQFSVVTAVVLFAMNYLLLVAGKWIVDVKHPFHLAWPGLRALIVTWLIEMVIVSQLLVNNFYRYLVKLYKRTAELEESESKSKFMALQSQLNPHFLFNSLNTLIAEIDYDKQKAIEFTRNLSDVYRYVLQYQYKQTVSLKSEVAFFKSYIFLHTVRLGDCIAVDEKIDDDLQEAQLPPLTLQLLVENIIKHNVISPSKPMKISIYTEDNNHLLCVSNPIRRKKDIVSSGKGLENLRERYELLSGDPIQVIDDNDCFTVKVPLYYE